MTAVRREFYRVGWVGSVFFKSYTDLTNLMKEKAIPRLAGWLYYIAGTLVLKEPCER